jgi:hypothetical protein
MPIHRLECQKSNFEGGPISCLKRPRPFYSFSISFSSHNSFSFDSGSVLKKTAPRSRVSSRVGAAQLCLWRKYHCLMIKNGLNYLLIERHLPRGTLQAAVNQCNCIINGCFLAVFLLFSYCTSSEERLSPIGILVSSVSCPPSWVVSYKYSQNSSEN